MIKQKTKFGLVYVPEYTSQTYYNKEVYNTIIEWLVKIYEVSLCYKTYDVATWENQLYVPRKIIKEYQLLINELKIIEEMQHAFSFFVKEQHCSLSVSFKIDEIESL